MGDLEPCREKEKARMCLCVVGGGDRREVGLEAARPGAPACLWEGLSGEIQVPAEQGKA